MNKKIKVFENLSLIERQILAQRTLCLGYAREKTLQESFFDILVNKKSPFCLYQNLKLTEYQVILKQLIRLGFSEHKFCGVKDPQLRHQLLLSMTEDELLPIWVMMTGLGTRTISDFEELYTGRTCYETVGSNLVNLFIAIYRNDETHFLNYPDNILYSRKISEYLRQLFASVEMDAQWLGTRKPSIQAYLCVSLLAHYYSETPFEGAVNRLPMIELLCHSNLAEISDDYLLYHGALIYLALGQIDKVKALSQRLKNPNPGHALALQASLSFLEGHFSEAQGLYSKALTQLRKLYRSRNYYFDSLLGVFYGLCLIFEGKNTEQWAQCYQLSERYTETKPALGMKACYRFVSALSEFSQGNQIGGEKLFHSVLQHHEENMRDPMVFALYHVLMVIQNLTFSPEQGKTLQNNIKHFIKQQFVLVAQGLCEASLRLDKKNTQFPENYLSTAQVKFRFLNLICAKETWEYQIQNLESLLIDENELLNKKKSEKRLLWLVDLKEKNIEVIEQVAHKNGSWSQGRAKSIERLKEYEDPDNALSYLSDEDKKAIDKGVVLEGSYWGPRFSFDFHNTLKALVGHPRVVSKDNRALALEFVSVEPELYVEEKNGSYYLSFSHWAPASCLIIEMENLNRYRLIDFSVSHAAIAQILGEKGLTLPAAAKDKIIRVLQHAKRDIKIHTEMKETGIPEMAGDPTPYIQLLPMQEGIRATLWVKPLPDNQGVCLRAAHGKEHLMVMTTQENAEIRIRVTRDFKLEKKNQDSVLKAASRLMEYETSPGEYQVDSPEDVLEILSALKTYGQENPLVLEWPQGETFKIKQKLNQGKMTLKIDSQMNWFEYGGELSLDDGAVLNLKELLRALDESSEGRFVRLSDGEFLELTAQFKKQLSLLQAISEGNRVNILSAEVLSDIASELEHTIFDQGWKAHVEKLKAMRVYQPQLPASLQASLRDYQHQGFQHLSRLSHWGLGACLADDMGLGKTVQAIALLCEQAKHGPALVIAPTSVCFNWIEEFNKFAPSLNIYNFRTEGREALIETCGPFDVIVCSYGLLQHNEALLSKGNWNCIILDEAQAIKNAHTKRWKAVMKLKANARIALSGTPIENHLGELWSIFSFINPGLLGSIQSFQNKYSTPIENHQNIHKVQALKTLVQPYILRRLKSEVLSELPPKIEQVIHVEPSKEEAAFYEALRRIAADRVNEFMAENNRMSVLAEITKLRLACCDSSLVDETIQLPNSKLKAFIETLKNIIENGHKALVFSQYVSFLKIVKTRIEAENMSYQYLDGSTSAANRKKIVEAFQSGESEVFLLSLKAGGSGLNLTAADYVIHLDPWWNPAVEDQASDRAHRIGQQRPVTVYRFVMQNTIEEKMLHLHQRKRDLAHDLLSGQGISGKLSNEDLLDLIGQQAELA